MKVSVVITTKNEADNIGNCLDSVLGQSYPQKSIEIIVVDNNSDDDTKTIAAKYTDKVFDYGPERSAQRNFGAKQSAGEYILFLDADMILSKNVISESVQEFESRNKIALYVPEKIIALHDYAAERFDRLQGVIRQQPFWIKVRNFERSFYDCTPIDAVRFVRREKFLKIKGFDESFFVGEDWDFDRRIKQEGETGIISSPILHNEKKFSFFRYLKKKGLYARNFAPYLKKWGQADPLIKKQLGFYYRYFGVFCEQGKWKKLFKSPVLAFSMYLLRFLVGAVFLTRRVQR